jgi:cytochrome c nitrite reductase small subunit
MNSNRALLVVAVAAAASVGCLAAVGGATFVTAHGTAYLSNDPAACVNCHVMRESFEGWQHSSHRAVAVCNDCHLPHQSIGAKFLVKASNGYHHSSAFTLQNFAEPIRIKPGNAAVLEANCLRCHGPMTEEITAYGTLGVPSDPALKADLYGCVKCHQEVGHGPRR